jgi:hypothetical protein
MYLDLTTAATAVRYMAKVPFLGLNDDINHATINRNNFTQTKTTSSTISSTMVQRLLSATSTSALASSPVRDSAYAPAVRGSANLGVYHGRGG